MARLLFAGMQSTARSWEILPGPSPSHAVWQSDCAFRPVFARREKEWFGAGIETSIWTLYFAKSFEHRLPAFSVSELDQLGLRATTATVMFADVVESVRLIQQDERGAVERIRRLLISGASAIVPRQGGRVIQRTGDGLMMAFPDAVSAARCSFELHALAAKHSEGVPAAGKLFLRIGFHSADILSDESSLYGHGVNVTARIAALARPGETLVSPTARDQLTQDLDGSLEDLGLCYVKHVAEPLRLFRLQAEGQSTASTLETTTLPLTPRLAILPFERYQSKDRSLNVGDVISDQLIVAMSRSTGITVISRLSCHALRGRSLSTETAAQKLGADYVLSGRFYGGEENLHFLPELVHAPSMEVLWAEPMSGSVQEVLSPDSDLVLRASKSVADALFQKELQGSHAKALPSLASHTLYLSAISSMHRFSEAIFHRAREILEALQERAPRHPAPLAWLSRWHMLRIVQGWSLNSMDDGTKALAFANRALDLDPESSLALTMLGSVCRSVKHDLDAAQGYFDQALCINPNEPLAWLFKGTIHGLQGETHAALDATDRALALSPLDPLRAYYESLSASAATASGQYDRGIILARRALTANMMHASSYRTLAIALAMQDRWDEARETVSKLLIIEPRSSIQDFRTGSRSPYNEAFAAALLKAGMPAARPGHH